MKITYFRGLEQLLMDMFDYPQQLHKLANFVMEEQLHKLDYLEKNNLLILNNDNTVKGFRIYMGATDNAGTQRISMVVGFGSPDHYQSIYAADMEESGPCPFICDETSPIVPQGK